LYHHKKGEFEYTLDTRVVKRGLVDVPISHPAVINLLRGDLKDNLSHIGID
jgi:hypothetical protein